MSSDAQETVDTLLETAPERIIACAVEFDDETVSIGINHGDAYGDWCYQNSTDLDDVHNHIVEEGYFTSQGRFVSREEGLDISRAAKQYAPIPGEEEQPWLDYQNVWNDRYFFTPAAVKFLARTLGPKLVPPGPVTENAEEPSPENELEKYVDFLATNWKVPVIAELVTDDANHIGYLVDFDCQDWLKQADDSMLLRYNRRDWGRDYDFDDIANSVYDTNPQVK